jgi:hypothetical protein
MIRDTVRKKIAEWALQLVRAYFIGKKITFFTRLDGQPIYRGEGVVMGGVIARDASRMPSGMTLYIPNGRDMRTCSVLSLKREKQIGWVSYD